MRRQIQRVLVAWFSWVSALAVSAAGELTVHVTTVDGAPSTSMEALLECGEWLKIVFPDEMGVAVFPDVPAAECTLDAWHLDRIDDLQWRSERRWLQVTPAPLTVELTLSVPHQILSASDCCSRFDYSPTLREEFHSVGLRCDTWWPQTGVALIPGPVLAHLVAPCRSQLLERAGPKMSVSFWKAMLRSDLRGEALRRAQYVWSELEEAQRLVLIESLEQTIAASDGDAPSALLALALKDEAVAVRAMAEAVLERQAAAR